MNAVDLAPFDWCSSISVICCNFRFVLYHLTLRSYFSTHQLTVTWKRSLQKLSGNFVYIKRFRTVVRKLFISATERKFSSIRTVPENSYVNSQWHRSLHETSNEYVFVTCRVIMILIPQESRVRLAGKFLNPLDTLHLASPTFQYEERQSLQHCNWVGTFLYRMARAVKYSHCSVDSVPASHNEIQLFITRVPMFPAFRI